MRKSKTGFAALLLVVLAVIDAFATHAKGGFVNAGPLYAWLIEFVLIFGVFAAWGFAQVDYWFGILVDGRNKISLSRLQISVWTIFFVATFFVIYVWNIGHSPDPSLAKGLDLAVPDAVWILMGISGVTAAGTPLILSAKPDPGPSGPKPPAPKDNDKELDGIVVKRKAGCKPKWSDLILGDEAGNADVIDISKVQQLLLSLVAVVAYGFAIGQTMSVAGTGVISALPGMTGGFLALIAASHATYLGYKAVSHSD